MAEPGDRFSRRLGVHRPSEGPLVHRDAPERLRVGTLYLLKDELHSPPS